MRWAAEACARAACDRTEPFRLVPFADEAAGAARAGTERAPVEPIRGVFDSTPTRNDLALLSCPLKKSLRS